MIMTNALREFLEHINEFFNNTKNVRCAIITFGDPDWGEMISKCTLPVGWNNEDFEIFKKQLDKEYDSGYGGQELFGTIWHTDGISWSHRGEYDGAEWWEFNTVPEIPDELMSDPSTRL